MYIFGDVHCPYDMGKLSTRKFTHQKKMTKNDFIIITGDFGVIWEDKPDGAERYWLKWLDSKNFTTLFVDGNHENFNRLSEYPIENFQGGKAQQISKSVWHLMRGEIYSLEGKSYFTFGGGKSHDMQYRTENKNWWKQELPTEREIHYARKNLLKKGNSVDVIITHCAPTHIQNFLWEKKNIDFSEDGDLLTKYFEDVYHNISYKHWYFGHYHIDQEIEGNHHCVYNQRKEVF